MSVCSEAGRALSRGDLLLCSESVTTCIAGDAGMAEDAFFGAFVPLEAVTIQESVEFSW